MCGDLLKFSSSIITESAVDNNTFACHVWNGVKNMYWLVSEAAEGHRMEAFGRRCMPRVYRATSVNAVTTEL